MGATPVEHKIEVKVAGKPTAQTVHTGGGAAKRRIRLKRPGWKQLTVLGLMLLLLIGGIWFAYEFDQARQEVRRLSNAQANQVDEATQVKNEVAKLVQIPSGETPTLATVTNAAKLQNQAFFRNAENGDKVLIFTNAKEAVLYRPSINKVIEIAPLNLGTSQAATPPPTPPATPAIPTKKTQ
jgi:hypothetical protein